MSINVVVQSTAAGVSVSGGTAVSIEVQGGVGPAGFITAPGTATSSFGVFQLAAGNGITITTTGGTFLIASYNTAQIAALNQVTSVAGRTGAITLSAADITAGTFVHARIPTISYTALSDVPLSFAPSSHTHDASAVTAGTFSHARIPTISFTALSNVPATFTPSAHTHSTADVVSFTAAAAAAAPVQSVQGRTGAVSLTHLDLTAAAATHTHTANVASVFGITGSVEITGSGLANVSKSGNTINIGVASNTATAAAIVALWPAIVLGG